MKLDISSMNVRNIILELLKDGDYDGLTIKDCIGCGIEQGNLLGGECGYDCVPADIRECRDHNDEPTCDDCPKYDDCDIPKRNPSHGDISYVARAKV